VGMIERKFCYLIVFIAPIWIQLLNDKYTCTSLDGMKTDFISKKEIQIWQMTKQIWQLFHSEEKEINELQENGWVKNII
jgi:hypothetical protein